MSKNNPNGVRQDSAFDYKTYEQNRKAESDKCINYMKATARKARRLPNIPKEKHDMRVCAILALIVKIRRKLDCRGLSCYFKENGDESRHCELRKSYEKSRLHQIIAETDPAVLQKIILGIANTDADRELHTDSSGFGLKIYTEWKHAKYGKMSVHKWNWEEVLTCRMVGKVLTRSGNGGRRYPMRGLET